VRILYESLLQRTTHIKVWISWAEFEISIGEIQRAREIYSKANSALEGAAAEERLLLLEQWRDFERKQAEEAGEGEEGGEGSSGEHLAAVEKLMPKRVKRRRQITTEDGMDAGWEEYFDYIFPQDASLQRNFRLLEAARLWKLRQEGAAEGQKSGDGDTATGGTVGGNGESDGSGEEDEEMEYGESRAINDY